MKAPDIPLAEQVELMKWMATRISTPSPQNRVLFRSAYEYASKITGLSVEEVEKSTAFMDDSTPRGNAAKWVEYFLNEYRKNGGHPPELPLKAQASGS